MFSPEIQSLAGHSAEMLVFYLLALASGNFGLVDFSWPLGFTVTCLSYSLQWFDNTNLLVLSTGYLLCGSRFLYGWIMRHGLDARKEDHRWQLWRYHWRQGSRLLVPCRNVHLNLLIFYMIQGWSNALFFTIPLRVIAQSANAHISIIKLFAIVLYITAFFLENVADIQLTTFKISAAKTGKKLSVCTVGLWSYSRHPNYFFEWLIWLSYSLFAIENAESNLDRLLLITSPLVAYWFLVYMTGIPITEEASARKRPEYREYQKKVPPFFPRLF